MQDRRRLPERPVQQRGVLLSMNVASPSTVPPRASHAPFAPYALGLKNAPIAASDRLSTHQQWRQQLWLDAVELRVVGTNGAVPITRAEHGLLEVLSRSSARWSRTTDVAADLLRRNDLAALSLVRQHIFRLRKKLRGLQGVSIEHCRRRGYRLHVDAPPWPASR
jgi:DNA-binding response OmpR family regulator